MKKFIVKVVEDKPVQSSSVFLFWFVVLGVLAALAMSR